jgi:hypothetical protein
VHLDFRLCEEHVETVYFSIDVVLVIIIVSTFELCLFCYMASVLNFNTLFFCSLAYY